MLRRKRHNNARLPKAPASAANPLHGWMHAFCEWIVASGRSEQTARTRRQALIQFIDWADERGLRHPAEVTRPILQRYQRHLYLYRTDKGTPLAYGSQASRMVSLVVFFRWLTREGHILSNPAADLERPRLPRQLPRHLMSVAQAEHVINQPDAATPGGLRDRAILEVLYSCGVRRGELTRLKIYEVDCERATLMVREGKGRHDRLLPLGERACAWVRRYLLEVRPELLAGDSETLFLTDYGEPFDNNRLSYLVRRCMRAAGLMHGACHAFRHAMATHMLEGGADIRYVQAMLGHVSLETTQIYTHVTIDKLRAVHALTHPARAQRLKPEDRPSPDVDAGSAAQTLLEALAREAEDEEGE